MTAIWIDALREVLLGPRGITKMSHLWLPAATLLLAGSRSDLKAGFSAVLALFFVVLFKVMFSIQVNDLCDRKEDEAAGKQRWIFRLPTGAGILITALGAAAGGIVIVVESDSPWVFPAYAASLLIGLFYSLRPVRLKERGILGLAGYALSATIIYVVVPGAWLDGSPLVVSLLFLAVFSDKWVQLHFHQVIDHAADLASGTRTFAVEAGLPSACRSLRGVALFAAFSIGCLLAYIVGVIPGSALQKAAALGLGILVVLASGVYAKAAKRKPGGGSSLIRELPPVYLGLSYLAFCALPPAAFAYLALREPLMWIVTGLSGLSLIRLSWQLFRYQYV